MKKTNPIRRFPLGGLVILGTTLTSLFSGCQYDRGCVGGQCSAPGYTTGQTYAPPTFQGGLPQVSGQPAYSASPSYNPSQPAAAAPAMQGSGAR